MIKTKEDKCFCRHCYREIDVEDALIENECPYCDMTIKNIKEINTENIK